MQIINIPYVVKHHVPFSTEEVDEIVAMDHVDPEIANIHIADLVNVSLPVAEQLRQQILLHRITAGMRTIDHDTIPF